MGLFSKKKAEPLIHADVARTIWVPAPAEQVATQLLGYSDLHSPKHADQHELQLQHDGGWTQVTLPPALHPWTFHNVAFWLLDTPDGGDGMIAVSGAGPTHPGYALVCDPELGDCLCGVDDDGDGWTVLVPTNEVVRPAPVPAVAAALPSFSGGQDVVSLAVLLEDPGRSMNPANVATKVRRDQLRMAFDHPVY